MSTSDPDVKISDPAAGPRRVVDSIRAGYPREEHDYVRTGSHPGAATGSGSVHDDARPFTSKAELFAAIEASWTARGAVGFEVRFAQRLSRTNLALLPDAADPVELMS